MRIEPSAPKLLLLGVAAMLLGCDKQAPAANDNANATANPAPAGPIASPGGAKVVTSPGEAGAGAMSADFLIGKWSAMGEDCSATVEFRKDGTAVTPVGEAKWTLIGDKLRFDYGDGSNQPPSTVKPLGKDRVETITQSGKKDTQKRC